MCYLFYYVYHQTGDAISYRVRGANLRRLAPVQWIPVHAEAAKQGLVAFEAGPAGGATLHHHSQSYRIQYKTVVHNKPFSDFAPLKEFGGSEILALSAADARLDCLELLGIVAARHRKKGATVDMSIPTGVTAHGGEPNSILCFLNNLFIFHIITKYDIYIYIYMYFFIVYLCVYIYISIYIFIHIYVYIYI